MSQTLIPIKITSKAAEKIREIRLEKQIPEEYALRVGMQGGGCGGMSFVLGFDLPRETDSSFELDGIDVLIEKKDTMYLLGMIVDFIERDGEQGFSFFKESEVSN